MASTKCIIFFAIIVVFGTLSSAKEIVVGDDAGWKLNFDYQTWAAAKEFVVGDTLVFNYDVGAHNVFKVNETSFQQCIKPAITEALTTGHDVVTLASPGKKWYICGVAQHCASGNMKLVINILPQSASPAPSPVSAAPGVAASSTYYGWMAAFFGVLFLGVV